MRELKFYQAGTFAEAGLLTLPAAAIFGAPEAGYTLHQYRVSYTLKADLGEDP